MKRFNLFQRTKNLNSKFYNSKNLNAEKEEFRVSKKVEFRPRRHWWNKFVHVNFWNNVFRIADNFTDPWPSHWCNLKENWIWYKGWLFEFQNSTKRLVFCRKWPRILQKSSKFWQRYVTYLIKWHRTWAGYRTLSY